MADLTRIQTAMPIQVTDANSSVVELAAALPSAAAIALVVREAAQGLQTSANSKPVVVASDQQVARDTLVVGQQSVGMSAVQLATNQIYLGVTVKASNSNSGTVYVGVSGVDSGTGFELGAGESISIPVDNTDKIYVIATVSSQNVSFIGV